VRDIVIPLSLLGGTKAAAWVLDRRQSVGELAVK
jgi:hypothetical protein